MGRNVGHAIDLVIEKKITSSSAVNNIRNGLYNYSKFVASKRHEFQKHYFEYAGLAEKKYIAAKVDLYDNKFYNFYENKVKKTDYRFNILKLFKPGELLTSVAGI